MAEPALQMARRHWGSRFGPTCPIPLVYSPLSLVRVSEVIPTAAVEQNLPTIPIHHRILRQEQPDCPLLRTASPQRFYRTNDPSKLARYLFRDGG